MTKTALAFLAGSLSVGALSFITHPAPIASGFALGMLTAVAIVAALIGSAPRTRRVVRFLEIVADGLSGTKTTTIRSISSARPKSSESAVEMPGPIERDVTSALVNFGMARKAAEKTAHEALASNPDGDLNSVLAIAMQSSRKTGTR
jgi:hypothetical protein